MGDFERDGVLLRAVEELQRLEPVVAGKMITGSGHHRKEQARAKVAGTGGPSSEQRRRQHLLFFLRFSGGSGLRSAAGPVRTPHNTPLQLGFFSFLYFKKIRISKIYGGFEKFQNYTPVAPCLGDRT